jgi:hypothetical protein
VHALRAERLHRERRGERRVDAAGNGDHHVPEAVLLDVVTKPELEPAAHLLQLVEQRCERRPRRPAVRPRVRRADVDRGYVGDRLALAGERTTTNVAQPPGDGDGGLDVDDQKRLLETRRTRKNFAVVVEHHRVPVEQELVLAADRVDEGDERDVVPGARGQHLLALALLAEVERRCGDVRDQLCAGERHLGGRRPGLPDVLADRRPDQHVAVLEQEQVPTRREVPVLVEDPVVRQEPLAVNGLDLTSGADSAGVVEVTVEVRGADERDDPADGAGDLLERTLRGADEAWPEQQVLGRVAGDRQLGEEDDVRVGLLRLGEPVEDALAVAVEVADDGVDLGERESHRCSLGFRLSVENVASRAQ